MAEVSVEIVLRWMPLDLSDEEWILVKEWLSAIRQQAITWANVDLDLRMILLGHNELN